MGKPWENGDLYGTSLSLSSVNQLFRLGPFSSSQTVTN